MSDAARTEAILAIIGTLACHFEVDGGDGLVMCSCGMSFDAGDWDYHCARVALDALLTSPQSVSCETCEGRKAILTDSFEGTNHGGVVPCPSCNGSGRIEKGPIAYLAGDVDEALRFKAEFDREVEVLEDIGRAKLGLSTLGEHALATLRLIERNAAARLPSESTNGVKDE